MDDDFPNGNLNLLRFSFDDANQRVAAL